MIAKEVGLDSSQRSYPNEGKTSVSPFILKNPAALLLRALV